MASATLTGDDLRRFRERRNLERGELAELLNASLGTQYDAESIGRWERGSRNPSKRVAAFLEDLALHQFAGDVGGLDGAGGLEPDDAPFGPQPAGDTAPGPGPSANPQPALTSGSGAYVRACTELWEMIATGIGMTGAALRSDALIADGAIIAADAPALGAAWGKLAETNDTFRRMLVGMTEGGAWLQVALVTGTTFTRCYQAHASIALERASLAAEQAQHSYDADTNGYADTEPTLAGP